MNSLGEFCVDIKARLYAYDQPSKICHRELLMEMCITLKIIELRQIVAIYPGILKHSIKEESLLTMIVYL